MFLEHQSKMASKIVRFSPKIEIINHFDELINHVDIEFDECTKNLNQKIVLGGQWFIKPCSEIIKCFCYEIVSLFESERNCEIQTEDLWPESTKIIDYLNQTRMRTIEELRKGQEEILEYYKLNSSLFKSEEINDENKIEEYRSKLFSEKFYFQLYYKRENKHCKPWIFNLFTFVTDFYMSPSDINLLK